MSQIFDGYFSLFQLDNPLQVCSNLEVFLTKEGLFLSRYVKALKLPSIHDRHRYVTRYLVSERDLRDYLQHEEMVVMDRLALTFQCQLVKESIFQMPHRDVSLMKIYDVNSKPINGNVYVPTCQKVSAIDVLLKLDNSYEDIPVTITLKTLLGRRERLQFISSIYYVM
jgi:hypothetical protein